jgi:hypothetical protein
MLVSGNWWNEAFIGPALREQAPELLTTAPGGSILIGSAIMSVTFAAGWVTFGLASVRAGVFPRRTVLVTSGLGCDRQRVGRPGATRARTT